MSFIHASLCGFSRVRRPNPLGFFIAGEASGTPVSSSGSVIIAPTLVTSLSVEIYSDSSCQLLLHVGFFGGTPVVFFL